MGGPGGGQESKQGARGEMVREAKSGTHGGPWGTREADTEGRPLGGSRAMGGCEGQEGSRQAHVVAYLAVEVSRLAALEQSRWGPGTGGLAVPISHPFSPSQNSG